jgi:hypothetical protein
VINGSGTGDVAWTGQSAGTATGVTLPYTITGLSSGSYTIGFFNGCPSSTVNATLTGAGAPAAPTVSVVDGCGSSVLTATGTGLVWSTGATTSSITVTTAGTYTVTQTVGGCTSPVGTAVANPLTVPSVTFPPLADVCINAPAFTLTGATPTGGVYSGTGVSANQFDPSIAGYGVFTIVYTYTDANGCSDSNQQPITVGCAGDEEIDQATYSLYPNPSSGQLFIEVIGMELEDMNVYDAAGKLVYDLLPVSENGIYVVDLSDLSQGVYSIEILSTGKTYRERVILTE